MAMQKLKKRQRNKSSLQRAVVAVATIQQAPRATFLTGLPTRSRISPEWQRVNGSKALH